ncbi:MAG: hypothetical protein P4L73_13340 [Caulobacteraceae bacterium]|nr:hypothetical protein [Caulobacteraceae bacterium]
MTDQTEASAAAPVVAPSAPPNWENIVALGICALTAIGGLVSVGEGVAPEAAMVFCGPVLMACGVAYQAGRGR